ncbi:MAG: hypothetical protein VX223_14250 [Myxococcota bacterium]|nr:hypothetical protein [Myxococcota bacterium]
MHPKTCLSVTILFITLALTGCNSPIHALGNHVDNVTRLYKQRGMSPADTLERVFIYLQTYNTDVATTAARLGHTLSDNPTSQEHLELAMMIRKELAPKRKDMLEARGRWQRAAVLNPATTNKIRQLGAVLVQEAQTTFDSAMSSLLRQARRTLMLRRPTAK